MSTQIKTALKIFGLAVLMALTAFVSSIITQDSGGFDPELASNMTDSLVPIIMGVITGLASSLIRSKANADTIKQSFDQVAEEGKNIFVSSASNVDRVVTMSMKTSAEIAELRTIFTEVLHEVKSLKSEVVAVKELGTSITNVEEITKLAFLNDPELVKNGIAKLIAQVGVTNED